MYMFVVEVVTYVAVLLIRGEIVLENMSEISTNPLPSTYLHMLVLYCIGMLCKYTVCSFAVTEKVDIEKENGIE